jgi:hypothetical protein
VVFQDWRTLKTWHRADPHSTFTSDPSAKLVALIPTKFYRQIYTMERYSVAVALHRDRETPLLLIPFQRTATISAFANEIKNRITRYNFCESGNDIFLRLRREDGPILDDNDILADVIHNPRTENIVVTSRRSDPRAVDPGSYLVSLAIAFNLLLRRADLVL